MSHPRLLSEVIWLAIAALIAVAAVAAPTLSVGPHVFLVANLAVVFGFVFVARLLFFHAESPLLGPLVAKGVAVVAVVPAALFTILAINDVQTFVDANGFAALFAVLATDDVVTWGRYVRNEFLFFGASLLLSLVALPPVLVVALWRQVKARGHQTHKA